jgi:hypothetical protein
MEIKGLKPKKNSKFEQGYYKPIYVEKYIGNPNSIIYRSSFEKKMFMMLDMDKDVIKWNSECIKIKYFYPVDKKFHYYYPDVLFVKNINGKEVTIIAEIKAKTFFTCPKKPPQNATKKQKIRYLKQKSIYIKNVFKKKYLDEYCQKMGYYSKVYTDDFFKKIDEESLMKQYSSLMNLKNSQGISL